MPSLMAVGGALPYIHIVNSAKRRRLPNPSTLPTGTGNGCSFSPDGSLLAVTYGTSPYITIYNTSNWSKVTNPSVLPPSTSYGCSFSPDGSLLAVTHAGSPYITIYNTSDWSTISDIVLATYDCRGVAFVQSGKLVLRGEVRDIDGYVASRKVRVYERSTGDLVAETTSSAVDGKYEASVYEGDVAYDVQFMADPLENLNDLFFAKAIAGTP